MRSYREMSNRLAELEAQAAPLIAEEEMTLEEACAAVAAEYSDLTPHEVLALDPVAFLVFLYWTGQLFLLKGWKGVPEFDAWIAQMHGWQPAALLHRLMAPRTFIDAVCALPDGVERAQAAIAAFLPRSHRNHPDHLTYLQKRIKQPEGLCQAT
jgi:hypothetical protein